jgi:hypothetical protein
MRKPPYISISKNEWRDDTYLEVGLETKTVGYVKLWEQQSGCVIPLIADVDDLSKELNTPFFFDKAAYQIALVAGWNPSPSMDYRLEEENAITN